MLARAAILATVAALAIAGNADCGAGIPDEQRLAELVVATAFESFNKSTEGTVVARLDGSEKREPVQIWVHEKGALREGSRKDLDRAFGEDRKRWPPYTLLYVVSPGVSGKHEVEIRIYYDMGLLPESRGGYAERWTVAHEGGRWAVLDRKTTLHWD